MSARHFDEGQLKNGGSKAEAVRVWYSVEMHDGDWALPLRQGPEAPDRVLRADVRFRDWLVQNDSPCRSASGANVF